MSRTVTLASLEAQVRQRSDTETTTQRFTSAEVREYINQSWAELYNYLLQSGQEFYLSSHSFDTSNDVTDYSLPDDFFLDKGVDATVSGQLVVFDRWQFEERERYDQIEVWSMGQPWAYAILGSNISLRPTPGGVYSVRLWYYPSPTRMTADDSVVDCLSGFEEYIVADAAAKILVKDDRDASMVMAQKAAAKHVIDMMITNRSRSNPNRVIRRWRQVRNWLRVTT